MSRLTEVWSTRTSTRARIADYLRVHQAVQGYPATSSEIAAGIALAVQSGRGGHGAIAYHLDALEAAGTIRRIQRQIQGQRGQGQRGRQGKSARNVLPTEPAPLVGVVLAE